MRHGRSALLGLVLFGPTTAYADTIFQAGYNPLDNETIIFNLPGLINSGSSVTGATQTTQIIFQFDSNQGLLAFGPKIQAMMDSGFSSFTMQAQNGTGFSSAVFNLSAAASGPVTFTAINNLGKTNSATLDVSASGPNFFTVTSDATLIMQLIVSGASLNEIDQIRIGGAGNGGTSTANAVPEPGSLLLVGGGLLAIGLWSGYRRWSAELRA